MWALSREWNAGWICFVVTISIISVRCDTSVSLHELARRGDAPSLRTALMDAEMANSLNKPDLYGWTPLFWAVDGGHVDAVRVLMQAKADWTVGRDGWSALMWACGGSKSQDLVNLFVNEFKVDVDRPAKSGKTALMVASSVGNSLVVTTLLAAGASPNLATADASSALALAASEGHAKVVGLLLAAGASLSPNGEGKPLVLTAVLMGHVEVAQQLLDAGASVDAQHGPQLTTALVAAAERGHSAMVEMLLGRKARVDAANAQGQTALARAASTGKKDVVQILLQAGAAVQSRDEHGLTPLMHAAMGGHEAVASVLLAAGASVVDQTTTGKTALELAPLASEMPSLKAAAEAWLGRQESSDFGELEVGLWLCVNGFPLWARHFRAAGITGAQLFADTKGSKRTQNSAVFAPSILKDSYKVLQWAVASNNKKLVDVLLSSQASGKASLDVNAAWRRAAVEAQAPLVQALADHPELDVHSTVPEVNKTPLELVMKLGPSGDAVRKRVSQRIESGDVAVVDWSNDDVVNWMVLSNQHAFKDAVRASAINGSQLISLDPEKVVAKDASVMSDGKRLLRWALVQGHTELVSATVKRDDVAAATCEMHPDTNLTPLEMVLQSATLQGAVPAVLAAVRRRQQHTPVDQWSVDQVVNWMHLTGLGDLVGAVRLDSVGGRELGPLMVAVGAFGGRSNSRARNTAVDLQVEDLYADGVLTKWAFGGKHRHLSAELAAAAWDVRTPRGFSSWVALHAELPSVQPAQTMLEIATSQKWHDIVELMTPLVSVRLASLPVALWTPTDTLNFVLAQGDVHLANAFRAEGDVSGKVMTGIARSAPDLLSELGNRTTLLLWALDNGFRHVAQHLLIDMPVDQPAGEGLGTPLEIATLRGVSGALTHLRKAAKARLAAVPELLSWTLEDVSNWLHLHGLGVCSDSPPPPQCDLVEGENSTAAVFRREKVDGSKLALLVNSTAASDERLLQAMSDRQGRLVWAMKENLPTVMSLFLRMLTRDQMGPVMLSHHPDIPSNQTLLSWIHSLQESKQFDTQRMTPVFRDFLMGIPLEDWAPAHVNTWLLIGGAATYIKWFREAHIEGQHLVSLFEHYNYNKADAAGIVSLDMLRNHTKLFEWSVLQRQQQIASMLVRKHPELAHRGVGALPADKADTALGVVMRAGRSMSHVTNDMQEMVMARLEGRGRFAARREEDWTPEDVANWQYVHGVTQFVLPIYQSGISGSMLLSLCNPLNVSMLEQSNELMNWAVTHSHTLVVRKLASSGVSPDMKDKYGTTPLMQAAWRGRADMLEALLAFGADKDAQNDNGYTALMRAAIRGNARTVSTLLRYNANVHMVNKNGKTAAALAKSKGHTAVADLLMQRQNLM